LTKNAKKQVR